MKDRVVILGASGHAKVVADIFEEAGGFEILGFLDSSKKRGERFFGYDILGDDGDIPSIIKTYKKIKFFIAVGDNWLRKTIFDKVFSICPNISFASAVHPSALIGRGVEMGAGVAVMAGSVINSGSVIGDFSIVNTSAGLDHDTFLGKFASVAPGAVVGGNVRIGDFSALSIGAVVKHGVSIGCHTVIGASALVLSDIGDNVVAYGIPVKEVRRRKPSDPYLD